jgi:ABC-2 type transport system permease protein
MKNSVVGQLILKDLRLQREGILFAIAGGAVGLAIFQHGGLVPMVVGSICFFVAMVVIACMLPIAAIVNERKKQNLSFLMSLPVSPMQYTAAKLVSMVAMFLLPWLAMVAAAVLVIETRGLVPRGMIPLTLIYLLLPFVGFTIIAGAALVGESEGWGVAATVVCNTSYSLGWFFLTQIPGLMADAGKPVPVWSRTVLSIMGGEVAFILLILALTFFLQSRKRDFI